MRFLSPHLQLNILYLQVGYVRDVGLLVVVDLALPNFLVAYNWILCDRLNKASQL